ncbi:hypothetical protein LOK49_LG05G01415 [Camellia lanceoleosa]|uniref:Uncharacterized protein n=1 Tax=Camellia lanceoleosa TaxID=1840588 RepID=A0ACC0HJZ6_9ERIC|nr:hypothetical protein LOK49_LG05G01415 [Camellia lanceoleosa]
MIWCIIYNKLEGACLRSFCSRLPYCVETPKASGSGVLFWCFLSCISGGCGGDDLQWQGVRELQQWQWVRVPSGGGCEGEDMQWVFRLWLGSGVAAVAVGLGACRWWLRR